MKLTMKIARMDTKDTNCAQLFTEKKRQAAIASVVAVVCCSEQDANAMLDFCGWDVTHAVERFLAGHPVPAPRHASRGPARPAQHSSPAQAASDVPAGRSGGGSESNSGGGMAGAAGGEVGMVRLPEGVGTGSGRVVVGDGQVFTGSWVNGIVQGHGHFQCSDKEYKGEFLDGRMHGKGTHRWTATGSLLEYDGEWLRGHMHGRGIVTKGSDQLKYKCEFDQGRLVRQMPIKAKPMMTEEERSYMVSIFQSVLQESTEQEACDYLAHHGWNLQVRS